MASIIDQDPFNHYTGNGVTTVFAYEFQLLAASDLVVKIDDVVIPPSQFVLVGVGNQSGGTVTFTTAPANLADVLLSRELLLERDTDYQERGDLLSATLDNDFNRLWQVLQGGRSFFNGALRFPYPEISPELPDAAARANTQLLFDALGNPYVAAPISGSAADVLLQLINTTDPTKGAALVGYNQAVLYTNGTVGSRLLQDVTTLDLKYMTQAEMDDVRSYGGALDVSDAIQAAVDDLTNTAFIPTPPGPGGDEASNYYKGGGKLYLGPGKYRITKPIKLGNGIELFGAAKRGFTYAGVTTDTGTIIKCDFPGTKRDWAFTTATYKLSDGTVVPFNFNDANNTILTTVCEGISIHDLFIDGGGCYGGIRLTSASDFDLQRIMVVNTGVGYFFNKCYGGHYANLMGNTTLYGIVLTNCTALECGNSYPSRGGGGGWDVIAAGDPTVRLTSDNMTTGAPGYMPADWRGKTYGLYANVCWGGMDFISQTTERWDIGVALDHVHVFTLTGYAELNIEIDYAFVESEGTATVFANKTAPTYIPGFPPPAVVPLNLEYRYAFGSLCNVTMLDCTKAPIYVGNEGGNSIWVRGGSDFGAGIDWTWSESITYEDYEGTIRVAQNSIDNKAVVNYCSLDEALRRIQVKNARDPRTRKAWKIIMQSGENCQLAANHNLQNTTVRFENNTGASPSTIAVQPNGGGIFRIDMSGDVDISFLFVNVTFPAAVNPGTGDGGLFAVISRAANIRLIPELSNFNFGGGWSLLQNNGGAVNVKAAWYSSNVTAAVASPILANYSGGGVTGFGVVTSIQKACAVDAGIKAIGTNGWQATTVLSSNF